jgi:hypothetical protein
MLNYIKKNVPIRMKEYDISKVNCKIESNGKYIRVLFLMYSSQHTLAPSGRSVLHRSGSYLKVYIIVPPGLFIVCY